MSVQGPSPPPLPLCLRSLTRPARNTGLFNHLYGHEMPGAHDALGDAVGLEKVLSAPGIAER